VNTTSHLLRHSIFLIRYSAVLFLTGCSHKLITVPVETAGKISCAALCASGKVAAETVKAAGSVACCAIENPDGAAAATAMIP
jgi:hypothetical protein